MQPEKNNVRKIHLKNKIISLIIEEFSDDLIETELLIQIDYNNIVGDIITFPVVFNRISLLKADMEFALEEIKVQLSILKSNKYKYYKMALVYDKVTGTGDKAVVKRTDPTENMVNAHITGDEEVIELEKSLLDIKHQLSVVDGLYWSAKVKSQLLTSISGRISPEEFENEIIEGKINNVMIKPYKKVF